MKENGQRLSSFCVQSKLNAKGCMGNHAFRNKAGCGGQKQLKCQLKKRSSKYCLMTLMPLVRSTEKHLIALVIKESIKAITAA